MIVNVSSTNKTTTNNFVPISSATALNLHYPFWVNRVVKGAGYIFAGTFGVLAFITMKRNTIPVIQTAAESAKNWFMTHLIEPTRAMIDELFFNHMVRTSSRQAYDEAKASLERMLRAYRKDHKIEISKEENGSFDLTEVNADYEKAIIHPIRESVAGDLVRLVLIQAQALKTETLHLGTEIEDVVAENHFNSQILAMLPALGIIQLSLLFLQRLRRWTRNEAKTRESAKAQLRESFWEVQLLLIREDDGPSLFSYLTNDDRGSEGGGSEHWVATGGGNNGVSDGLIPLRRSSLGDDEEDITDLRPYVDETLAIEPITRYRRQLVGQLIMTLHHIINVLIRSRNVLFRGKDKVWRSAMRDVGYLFPREGWTAHARLQLAQCLAHDLMSLV